MTPSVGSHLRLVVMGTGPFAVPMLEALTRSSHPVAAVVTRPDRTAPGRRPPPHPMRAAAIRSGLPLLDPADVNAPASRDQLADLGPDLLVVCDYGQLLSAECLAVAPLGGINLHGSLLPRHRGAAPVQWAILAGDALTGVSVIRMTPALDAGDILLQRSIRIEQNETAVELESRLAALGAGAVVEVIDRLASAGPEKPPGVPQDAGLATRAPRLSKADGIVAWESPAAVIERRRRALEPWPRLATFVTDGSGCVRRLVLESIRVIDWPDGRGDVIPGTVLVAEDDRLLVACGGGTTVAIERVVPEGRRSMTAGEFLRGHPLLPGSVLGGP